MHSHTWRILGICLSLVAVAGTASADLIIDENFDAPARIMIPMGPNEVLVTAMSMNMWFGGAPSFNMAWGTALQMTMMMLPAGLDFSGFVAHSRAGVVPDSGLMGLMGWASVLTYFAAQPAEGWGVEELSLSFDYQYFVSIGDDTIDGLNTPLADIDPAAEYGVFGWMDNEILPLEYQPGTVVYPGTMVMHGMLPATDHFAPLAPTNIFDQIVADLSGFDFLGVVFGVGDWTGDPHDSRATLLIDNVVLSTPGTADVIPEPATLSILALGMAAAARRLRRRKRA